MLSGNISLINLNAKFNPSSTLCVSTPFSNLIEASVFSANFLSVCLTVSAEKFATSNTTPFVSGNIESFLPPLIPANAIASLSSHITKSSVESSIKLLSNNNNFSFSLAFLTIIFSPLTCVLSKA